jgi:hypothetical protein
MGKTIPTTGSRTITKTTGVTAMGTVIARDVFPRNWRKPNLPENTVIDYKPFRVLADLKRRNAITREHFILDWKLAQRDQGIRTDAKKTR